MNWNQFLICLGGLYLLYYLFNVLVDLLRNRVAAPEDTGQLEISFTHPPPQQVTPEPPPQAAAEQQASGVDSEPVLLAGSGKLQFTGGLSISELFALAQAELIEHTKDITY